MAVLGRTILGAVAAQRMRGASSLAGDRERMLSQQVQDPVTQEGEHPFAASTGEPAPFAARPVGVVMTFPLPGAVKIAA
jgi:hypothetical protein